MALAANPAVQPYRNPLPDCHQRDTGAPLTYAPIAPRVMA